MEMEDGSTDFGVMNERHHQVVVWLEQVCGGERVPQFELKQKTLSILYGLMKENQLQDRNTQLIINDLRQKTLEYGAEAQRLSGVLKQVRLSQGCLSQSGVTSLQTLVNLALHLDLKGAADSNFLLALQSLSDEFAVSNEEKSREEKALVQFSQKTKSALHKYSALLKTLRDLEENTITQRPETEKRRSKVNFLLDKAKQYQASIKKNQVQLTQAGADPAVHHSKLVNKFKDLQNLRKEIDPLRKKLQSYNDLPPDLSQTKVKIQQLKQQVSSLEEELTRKIDLMHL